MGWRIFRANKLALLLVVNYIIAVRLIRKSTVNRERSLGDGVLRKAVDISLLQSFEKTQNTSRTKEEAPNVLKNIRVSGTPKIYSETFTKSDSPACRPSWRRNSYNGRIRRIFFAHTRKTGGTTLQRFLERVAKQYRWKIDYVEGRPAEEPTRNDTLYVTSLREPVARAISNFKYEIRWPCSKLVSPEQYPDYLPSPNNSRTLEDFIERESGKFSQKECWRKPNKRTLWRCARNCYLRWYGRNFNCLKNPEKSYETAMEKLLNYNLIVITERLADPSYVDGLMHMFGNVNTTILSTTQKMYCFDESRHWNAKYPASVNENTLANLTQLNALDIRLYNEITACQEGIVFPDFSPRWRRKSKRIVS